jgi:hypothetical protein
MDQRERRAEGEQPALTYRKLRLAVGLVGLALPFVVVVGNLLLGGHGRLSSISAYYYTPMGTYLVGSLCVIGVFLLAYVYRGVPSAWMTWLAPVGGVGSLLAGLFPTPPVSGATHRQLLAGDLHAAGASVLFLVLGLISLLVFPVADASTPRLARENVAYRVLGAIILAASAAALVVWLVARRPFVSHGWLFWFETVAVLAFSLSWLLKGEAAAVVRTTVRRLVAAPVRR